MDEAKRRLAEAEKNRYWVRFNANPEGFLYGDCGFRAMTKSLGISYEEALAAVNELGIRKYKTDRNGKPTYDGHYNTYLMEIMLCSRYGNRVSDVFDMTDVDLQLIEFAAYASRVKCLKDSNIIAFVKTGVERPNRKRAAADVEDPEKFKAAEELTARLTGIPFSKMDGDHVVSVKNGRYYDTWDSGRSKVRQIMIIKDAPARGNGDRFLNEPGIAAAARRSAGMMLRNQMGQTRRYNHAMWDAMCNSLCQDTHFIAYHLKMAGVTSNRQLDHVVLIADGSVPCSISDIEPERAYGLTLNRTDDVQYGFMDKSDCSMRDICENSRRNMRRMKALYGKYHDPANPRWIDSIPDGLDRKMMRESMFDRKNRLKPEDRLFQLPELALLSDNASSDYDEFYYVKGLDNRYTHILSKLYGEKYWAFALKRIKVRSS